MTTNWPELDKDHLIKICIDQNIELDALRAKLAAMESQVPVCYANHEWIKKLNAGTLFNRAAVAAEKTDSQGYSMPLYAKPVPADKPAELRYCNDCDWKGTSDRMCGSIGPLCPECGETTGVEQSPAVTVPDVADEEMLEVGVESLQRGLKLFPDNLYQVINNVWEDMYEAAPSHSQQSAYKAHEWDGKGICKKCGVTIFGRRDACPSHESEQSAHPLTGDVKAIDGQV